MSLLILTIGLLALGQLYASSIRATTESHQRTIAQLQAVDMGERIWLNLANPLEEAERWKTENLGTLPGWEGNVEADPDDVDLFLITIAWQPSGRSNQLVYHYALRLPHLSR